MGVTIINGAMSRNRVHMGEILAGAMREGQHLPPAHVA